MRHSGLKIALATLLAIFDLAACFAGAFAWFTAATVNNASNMQVQMRTHELDMSYLVYKYDDELKEAVNATGRPDALTLKEYDSVITSRNENTSIVLEFVITGMDLGENIPLHINTHCSNDTTTDRVLSNIIQLQFAAISSISSSDANEIYSQSVSYFDENHIPEVTFKTGNSKAQDVVYDLADYESSIIDGSLRLYIKLDYSISLIDEFDFNITDATTTSFANDITLISCYTDED